MFTLCSDSHYVAFQVEVDVLTGATIILRTDIIYDCGQSLNPAVDLGQVGSLSVPLYFLCESSIMILNWLTKFRLEY